jgi:hypothetical protein
MNHLLAADALRPQTFPTGIMTTYFYNPAKDERAAISTGIAAHWVQATLECSGDWQDSFPVPIAPSPQKMPQFPIAPNPQRMPRVPQSPNSVRLSAGCFTFPKCTFLFFCQFFSSSLS